MVQNCSKIISAEWPGGDCAARGWQSRRAGTSWRWSGLCWQACPSCCPCLISGSPSRFPWHFPAPYCSACMKMQKLDRHAWTVGFKIAKNPSRMNFTQRAVNQSINVPIKGFNAAEQFAIVAAVDQDLGVVFHRLRQYGKRPSAEFFFFQFLELFLGEFTLRFNGSPVKKERSEASRNVEQSIIDCSERCWTQNLHSEVRWRYLVE